MKIKLSLFLTLVILFPNVLFAQNNVWHRVNDLEGLENVVVKYGINKKYLVLFFYASWAVPAQQYRDMLWVDEDKYSEFMFVEVDMTKNNDDHKYLYEKYKFQGIPEIIVVDRKYDEITAEKFGQILKHPKQFESWLNKFISARSNEKVGEKINNIQDGIDLDVSREGEFILLKFKLLRGVRLYFDQLSLSINLDEITPENYLKDKKPQLVQTPYYGKTKIITDSLEVRVPINVLKIHGCKSSGELLIKTQTELSDGIIMPIQKRYMEIAC